MINVLVVAQRCARSYEDESLVGSCVNCGCGKVGYVDGGGDKVENYWHRLVYCDC